MPRFLIEVEHEGTTAACNRAIELFLRTGSHFLTRADWGCKDGEHKAWMTVEVGSKDEARGIVPSELRGSTKVVQLNEFTVNDIPALRKSHPKV